MNKKYDECQIELNRCLRLKQNLTFQTQLALDREKTIHQLITSKAELEENLKHLNKEYSEFKYELNEKYEQLTCENALLLNKFNAATAQLTNVSKEAEINNNAHKEQVKFSNLLF